MENSLNNLPVWGIESHTGYKPKTTYWQDFSVADKYGEKAVRDTYNRSMNDLKRFEDCGLQNSGMEGDPDLFDSMDSYFEDERHDEEAKVLMSMMKDEWEQNWRDDSVYDYLGNREKEAE